MKETHMDDVQFRKLLHHLGLSWTGYRKVRKGVKKRISRHMRLLNCSDLAGYLHELGSSKGARYECERLMTVSISRFFRDKKLWVLLLDKVLPELHGYGSLSYVFKKQETVEPSTFVTSGAE